MKFKELTKLDIDNIHTSKDINSLMTKYGKSMRTIYSWKEKIQNIIDFNKSHKTDTTTFKDIEGIEDNKDSEQSDKEVLLLRKQLSNHKNEISKLRTELKDALKEATTTSAIKSLIHGVNKDFNVLPEWISPNNIEDESALFDGLPVLFLSDLHFDEIVDAGELGGINSYNRQIAIDRLKYTVDNSIKILKHDITGSYDGIILALGGDMLSGIINSGREHNEAPITETILILAELLISIIERLTKEFGRVFVPCVTGNHGRLEQQYKFKHKTKESFEYIMYHIVAKHFRNNSDVTVYIPDEPDAYFTVYNTKILLTHGDFIKGGGSGIAGVLTPIIRGMLKKKSMMSAVNKNFDIMMIGHFHQYNILGSGSSHSSSVIMNGSCKGYDEYSKGLSLPFSQPEQALFIIHKIKGVTFTTPIQCNGYEQNIYTKTDNLISVWKG